jgi:hypothetical protein
MANEGRDQLAAAAGGSSQREVLKGDHEMSLDILFKGESSFFGGCIVPRFGSLLVIDAGSLISSGLP